MELRLITDGNMRVLSLRNHSRVLVVHGDKCTEVVRDLIDNALHQISLFVGRFTAEVRVDLHGRREAPRLVDVEGHEHAVPRADTPCLLMERKEQVLLQSPVKKCADSRRLADGKVRCLMKSDLRLRRRRDQAVRGVPVNEGLYFIARLCSLRHLPGRQQHAVLRTCVPRLAEIRAVILDADDHECFSYTNFHIQSILSGLPRSVHF